MKIAIASDHGGFDLKEQLKEYYAGKGTKLDDLGTYSSESCDYPDIAKAMCDRILSGEAETGILICGTGIGISIAANRCGVFVRQFCTVMRLRLWLGSITMRTLPFSAAGP